VATAAPDGTCDVSPRGDPPGFTHVLDERTIAILNRPGNRRVDGSRNVRDNPHVGLIFVIPGRGDTLRINGTAQLLHDAPFFDEMVVSEHRPRLVLLVCVEEVFFRCSKALLRSSLWDPASWAPEEVAPRAQIAKALEWPDEPWSASRTTTARATPTSCIADSNAAVPIDDARSRADRSGRHGRA